MCQGKLSEEVKGEPMFYEEKLEDSVPDENSRKEEDNKPRGGKECDVITEMEEGSEQLAHSE